MQTFGECSISIGGARRILRGDAEFEGIGGLELKVEPNLDGSVYQTAKTAPVMLKLKLEDEVDAIFTKAELTTAQDVVFVEEQNGRTHILSSAKIDGKVTYNPSTGELAGFSFACAVGDYQRRGA